jgi:hypothetical protein
MARKLCSLCNTRSIGTGPGLDAAQARVMGYCNPCLTEAEYENEHSDNAHEDPIYSTDAERAACWICHPELNPNNGSIEAPKAGHTNTVAKSYRSHAGCKHVRTPAARAVCRKTRKA